MTKSCFINNTAILNTKRNITAEILHSWWTNATSSRPKKIVLIVHQSKKLEKANFWLKVRKESLVFCFKKLRKGPTGNPDQIWGRKGVASSTFDDGRSWGSFFLKIVLRAFHMMSTTKMSRYYSPQFHHSQQRQQQLQQ